MSDLVEAARRAAWELVVHLRTTVLPSAVGEVYDGERLDELHALKELAEAGPWLADVIPGLTGRIRAAAEALPADSDDGAAWMELADARLVLCELLGTKI